MQNKNTYIPGLNIRQIVVPTDFSLLSLIAVDPAVRMAKLTGASVSLIHVVDVISTVAPSLYFQDINTAGYEIDLTDASNRRLEELAEKIKMKGVENVTVFSGSGQIYTEIISHAKEINADVIIMGTHGTSGLSEYFIGSNTFRVISHADCPVLSIQRNNDDAGFKNIVVPFSDKPHSREKINYAITIARMYGATLHVLGVDTEGGEPHHQKLIREAEQIKKIIGNSGVECEVKVITGDFLADTVMDYAKIIKADLVIVTADMDKVSISEYFMGPFAQQIVNHSKVPVLSIHPAFNTDTIDLRFY